LFEVNAVLLFWLNHKSPSFLYHHKVLHKNTLVMWTHLFPGICYFFEFKLNELSFY
jgi:hypothetical protein